MERASNADTRVSSRKQVGVTAAVLLVVISGALLTYQLWPRKNLVGSFSEAYYSDDDGASYFTASIYDFPPFDHNGKTAYGARVFQAANGHTYVGYLERLTDQAHSQLANAYSKFKSGKLSETAFDAVVSNPGLKVNGIEAKLPGANKPWLPLREFPASDIKSPEDGSRGIEVYP